MTRSANPSVNNTIMTGLFIGNRTPTTVFDGIQDAVVIDTDQTNPSVQAGFARIKLAVYSDDHALYAPYPGPPPPDGAAVVVGFVPPGIDSQAENNARILVVYGQPGPTGPTGPSGGPVGATGPRGVTGPTGP